MTEEAVSPPWFVLGAGLVSLAYGFALRAGAPWIGKPLTAGERRGSSIMLIALGAAFCFLFWSESHVFLAQRPYVVVILATILWPVGTFGFAGWMVWYGVLRNFQSKD